MKRTLSIACLYTLVTACLLGIAYPLLITGVAQLTMRRQANGDLLYRNGQLIGSSLIGQQFLGPQYFHSRPSVAGNGYDASASSGSNLGPTNRTLIERVNADATLESTGTAVPVDLVTTSGSGLDPDITPAAAQYQSARVASARHVPQAAVEHLVEENTTARQFGLLGEPRVNVLTLNLALDREASAYSAARHP